MSSVEIEKGIYWVGDYNQETGLHCNPYLIIDNGEGVLIDPGSVLDFEVVYKNVIDLISLDKIKYIVANHQDPDICSSTPLFEKKGMQAKIVTHWRTMVIVTYYGIKSEFYITNENQNKLVLSSGRELTFINTPYLHFPGAITTYDPVNRILFSSDLFGAFSHNWELFASDNYIESMKTFHENYMPGNDNLRPVMEIFYKMDIDMIAPQHGSIIKDNVKECIMELRELECGTYLNPIKREISKIGGYTGLCNSILKRYYSIYNKEEVIEVFKDSDIEIDKEKYIIKDYNVTGKVLWNVLFETIYLKKGLSWISVIETLVEKLSKEYEINMPQIYTTNLLKIEKEMDKLNTENERLTELNKRLENSLKETQEKMIKCPITKLYNEAFFKSYLNIEIEKTEMEKEDFCLIFISIDNVAQINLKYGNEIGNETIKNLAYLLNDIKKDTHLVFKLEGAFLAYMIPDSNLKYGSEWAEKIRNYVEKSEIFIENITVSIGVVEYKEISEVESRTSQILFQLLDIGNKRVELAKNKGGNSVSITSVEKEKYSIGKIVIVDTDNFNKDLLKTMLEEINYKVFCCSDGMEALELIEKEIPDMVITEIMIPKIDAFILREKMLDSSMLKDIPMIITSYQKDEMTIERAFLLKVDYYLKKPYMLSEIMGVIRNKLGVKSI